MTGLHWTTADLRLPEAIASASATLGGGVTALIYATSAFAFARVTPSGLEGPHVPDHEQIFELRCFSAVGELRWFLDGDRIPRACLLTTTPQTHDPFAQPRSLPGAESLDVAQRAYLLWGVADGPLDEWPGWTRLAEARLGAIAVPLQLPDGARARLICEEQIAVSDTHGNARVIEERLVRLERFPSDRKDR